ncbi:hypothetical protein M0804_015316 [Polistes exclamans]|nr:hypothetical protein M0804_015316 [Polistes exclamans]
MLIRPIIGLRTHLNPLLPIALITWKYASVYFGSLSETTIPPTMAICQNCNIPHEGTLSETTIPPADWHKPTYPTPTSRLWYSTHPSTNSHTQAEFNKTMLI